jgi:hypothetical protein
MIEAIVVPFPNKTEHKDKADFFHEFTNADYRRLDLVGAPIWFGHDDQRPFKKGGIVTDQFFDGNDNLCMRAHMTYTPEGIGAIALIRDLGYREVSLQHVTTLYEDHTYVKRPIEVSICRKGRRDSPITAWRDHAALEDFVEANPTLTQLNPFVAIKAAYAHTGRPMPASDFTLPPLKRLQFASKASRPETDAVSNLKFDEFLLPDNVHVLYKK